MSNKEQSQHTPTPWEIETKGSKHFIDGSDGLTVAYLDRSGVREKGEIEANAAFIVTACNAYEANQSELASNRRTIAELTAALRDIASEQYAFPSDIARAALARAKEASK